MSGIKWAENEVKLACEREAPNRAPGEWDYGCACYESALKAYKSMAEDGHSGFSWSLTADILKRLIDGEPLTAIEDTPEEWHEAHHDDGTITGQCKRRSTLFKNIKPDGTVEYRDMGSYFAVDINDPTVEYKSRLVSNVVHEIWPVTFPYYPNGRAKVVCRDILIDKANGDFDTRIIYYAEKNGQRVEINRIWHETDKGFVEITAEELDKLIEEAEA